MTWTAIYPPSWHLLFQTPYFIFINPPTFSHPLDIRQKKKKTNSKIKNKNVKPHLSPALPSMQEKNKSTKKKKNGGGGAEYNNNKYDSVLSLLS